MLKLFTTSIAFVALAYGGLLELQEVQGSHVASSQPPPYHVSLAYYNKQNNTYKHWCSGSIISSEWILTAGSCFDKRLGFNKNAPLVILTGSGPFETNTVRSHQEISEPTYYWWYFINNLTKIAVNDLILIKVPKPFVFDANLQPVQLYDQDEETVANSSASLSGWVSAEEFQNPKDLDLSIISKYDCNILLHGGLTYTGQICAAYKGNESSSCNFQADPGSPLIINGRLAGILSWWSDPCASPEEGSIYTEVGYFRNWIKSETGI